MMEDVLVIPGPNEKYGLTDEEDVLVNFRTLFEGLDNLLKTEDADPREDAIATIYDEWTRLRSNELKTNEV